MDALGAEQNNLKSISTGAHVCLIGPALVLGMFLGIMFGEHMCCLAVTHHLRWAQLSG
jgi:hypothetical protein